MGTIWAQSEDRPRLSPVIISHWDKLLEAWGASDLPLIIRKSSGIRGSLLMHSSGRGIILSDNSPAQWSFSRAFEGQLLKLEDVRNSLEIDDIPFSFATKVAEKAFVTHKATLGSRDNINKRGWKLCHIEDVGLNTSTAIESLPIDLLIRHFKLLIAPSNHFLIPLELAGLGELKDLIDEVRSVDRVTN